MAEEIMFIEYQIPQNESGSITQVIRKNYTRAEAIDLIAKAIYVEHDNTTAAEAALNALLECK